MHTAALQDVDIYTVKKEYEKAAYSSGLFDKSGIEIKLLFSVLTDEPNTEDCDWIENLFMKNFIWYSFEITWRRIGFYIQLLWM